MKQLLVGGGFIDFITLHPLWAVLGLGAAVVAARRARAFGPRRGSRARRPPAAARRGKR
jgi:hypothetical protein